MKHQHFNFHDEELRNNKHKQSGQEENNWSNKSDRFVQYDDITKYDDLGHRIQNENLENWKRFRETICEDLRHRNQQTHDLKYDYATKAWWLEKQKSERKLGERGEESE